jgi:DNA-binding transcriptional MerR regulator
VNGNIGTQDIIVTNTGWSDYVFQPGYRLRPLSEVKAYIQANHHLPDIPSEAEVKEKGVSVGEMQSKLLAKVEELTLHMIQADERNTRLEQQNQELRDRLARLEKSANATPTAAK